MNNQDGQSIKDITETLRGGQPQPSLTGASSKTRHPGSQNLRSTRPALTRSSAKAGQAVKGGGHGFHLNTSAPVTTHVLLQQMNKLSKL